MTGARREMVGAIPIEALPDPALVVDARGRIRAANEPASMVPSLRAGHPLSAAAPPFEALSALVEEARRAGAVRRSIVVDPSRGRRWIVAASPWTGHACLVVLTLADPALEHARASFERNLVHELRNVAFGLTATMQGLDGSDASFAEALGHARASTQRVANLAERLSTLQESVPVDLRELDLGEVLDAASVLAKLPIERKGAFGLRVRGHRQLVLEALLAVLENAALCREHEPIEIDVQPRERDEQRYVAIAVRDRGSALPPFDEARVWEPLYRRRRGGLGLGLAIARQRIVAQGGFVEARRREGGGAEFVLALPAAS